MKNVIRFPSPSDVDRLWADYRALALEVRDDPRKRNCPRFISHVCRAHRLFTSAYEQWCRK